MFLCSINNFFYFQYLESQIKNKGPLQIHPQKPLVEDAPVVDITNVKLASPPNYKSNEQVATRLAYGVALAKLAQGHPRVIALDGDTKNSTFSDKLKKVRMLYVCITLPNNFTCLILSHILKV